MLQSHCAATNSSISDKGLMQFVDGVDFKVGDGEFVAIIGPLGCGKTTLMNMVAGFLKPDQGSVIIDGVERLSPSAKGILISQHGSVFPWLTVQELRAALLRELGTES